MKLIERDENDGSMRTIKVLERLNSVEHTNIVTADPYRRGSGIRHILVDDAGAEEEIELLNDCPAEPPYAALARPLQMVTNPIGSTGPSH